MNNISLVANLVIKLV